MDGRELSSTQTRKNVKFTRDWQFKKQIEFAAESIFLTKVAIMRRLSGSQLGGAITRPLAVFSLCSLCLLIPFS